MYRAVVSKQLGYYESRDQVSAAKWMAKQSYIDPKRIALWGWSYGGYLTAKTMEMNSGVFSLGMSVAPVVDWRYYDTMYTERYMKTPQQNPQGYEESAVVKMEGFRKINYLLASGTADDNVHFHHAANLVWKLTGAGVTSYRVQYYTDSDHSIAENGAQAQVYGLIRRFVSNAFGVSLASSNGSSSTLLVL